MTEESFKRKLTAILSADVEGYSRMMGEDEDATIRTLTAYRELMTTLIQKHRGRVVDSPGDNLLAEFLSVVDAVRCAVEIQEELRVRNDELPENRRMQFRIGINLGDVVEEQERIYGDGVNIAARVEGLAEGGGICISGTVYDSIRNKLTLSYESIGEHNVKNIKEPVRVYRMRVGPEAAVPVGTAEKAGLRKWRRAVLAAVAVLVVAAGAWAIWNFYFRPPPIDPASVEKMAYPLPDKPSIAVLPFKNLSGDQGQEFLADGITESIIGTISRVSGLFVIASNSVFTYKGKPVKVQTVSEELGVRNILEGTVQRAGNQLRVNAQLIDATTGRHLWSEKYDQDMKDLFSVQDHISKEILTALRVKFAEGEQERVWARGTNDLEAYLKFLKAYDTFKSFNKQNMILTRQICEETIAIDPTCEPAHSLKGVSYLIDLWFGWSESPRSSIEKCEKALKESISLNPQSDFAYANLGHLYLMKERHDEALAAGEKSVNLNPNGDYNMVLLAMTLMYSGRSKEAISLYKEAWRLNPYCPAWYIHAAGVAYRDLGKWDEGIAVLKRALEVKPDHFPALLVMASIYGMSDQLNEGQAVAAEILRINPGYCIKKQWLPYKDKAVAEAVQEALRKVGIPENPPLPLPDKPSIAVLPFTNMSGDPEQEYFSDGITEEIITALSKTPKLFVIARNSTFTYKNKPTRVQKVGRELGVKYVLEGSVRKAGDKVRITTQLVDAKTGNHIWAERYDRDLKDIFALQDEITMNVIEALELKLTEGEQALIYAGGTNNLEAYLKSLQAIEYSRRQNPDDNQKAKRILEEAIGLDPNYAMAYRQLGTVHMMEVWMGTTKAPKESLGKAAEFSKKALALDASLGMAHALLGHIFILMRNYEKGIEEGQRAVDLEPNGADSHAFLGMGLQFADRPEEAIKILKKAIRLNPMPPGWYLHNLAIAYRNMDRYDEAIEWAKKAVDRHPSSVLSHLALASCYSLVGREEEAQAEATQVLRIDPKFSLERIAKTTPQKNQETKKRFIDSLRKAGLK